MSSLRMLRENSWYVLGWLDTAIADSMLALQHGTHAWLAWLLFAKGVLEVSATVLPGLYHLGRAYALAYAPESVRSWIDR